MSASVLSEPAAVTTRSLARGTTWLSSASAVIGLVNYVYALALTHLLSVDEFPAFAAGQGLLLIVGTVAGTATPWVLAREVASAADDAARARAVRFALLLNLVVGAIGAVVVAGVAGGFSTTGELILVGLSAALIVIASTPIGWWQGREAFGRIAAIRVTEVVVKAVGGIVMVALGAGVAGAIGAFALGSVAALVAGGPAPFRYAWTADNQPFESRLWRAAAGMAGIQGLVAVLASADIIAVALLDVESASAASYQASVIVARVPLFLAGAVSMAIFPMLSRTAERSGLVTHGVGLFAALVVPSSVLLMTVPDDLAGLVFPEAYGEIGRWLGFTAAIGAATGVVNLLTTFFQAAEDYAASIRLQVAGLVVDLSAMAVGYALYGLAGLAVGAIVGTATTAALLLRLADDRWRGAARELVRTIARWAPAALVLAVTRTWVVLWVAVAAVVGLAAVLGAISAMNRRSGDSDGRADVPADPDAPPMRILHLGFEDHARPNSGGGAIRTHEINRRLAAAGHDVTVLTTNWKGAVDRVDDGVRYVHIGLPIGYSVSIFSYFLALPFAARRHAADLVVEDFAAPISSALAPLWTRRPTIAMVQWLNSREKSKQYKLPFFVFENAGVRLHRRYVAVSEDLGAQLRDRNGHAEVTVVPNGVEPQAFATEPTGTQRRDIVFLGRLETAQKGLDLLLEAFASIADRTDADLVLVGEGPDRDRLTDDARRLGLEDRIRFAGWKQGADKYQAMADAAVVAMPSRFETFGMVAVEALAVGTPVIAFEIPCLREVVPADAGVLVPAFDVTAFGSALLALLDDADRRHAMGEAGRRFARRFDWDAIADAQARAYRAAIRPRRP